jgi:hypothetical protein
MGGFHGRLPPHPAPTAIDVRQHVTQQARYSHGNHVTYTSRVTQEHQQPIAAYRCGRFHGRLPRFFISYSHRDLTTYRFSHTFDVWNFAYTAANNCSLSTVMISGRKFSALVNQASISKADLESAAPYKE